MFQFQRDVSYGDGDQDHDVHDVRHNPKHRLCEIGARPIEIDRSREFIIIYFVLKSTRKSQVLNRSVVNLYLFYFCFFYSTIRRLV